MSGYVTSCIEPYSLRINTAYGFTILNICNGTYITQRNSFSQAVKLNKISLYYVSQHNPRLSSFY